MTTDTDTTTTADTEPPPAEELCWSAPEEDAGGIRWVTSSVALPSEALRDAAIGVALWAASTVSFSEPIETFDSLFAGPADALETFDRTVKDPVYRWLSHDLDARSRTERWKKPFSSCPYLPHVMLASLGFTDFGTGTHGEPNQHAMRELVNHPATRPHMALRPPGTRADWPAWAPGDVLQIGSGTMAHALVVLREYREEPSGERWLLSADWGQPGGGIRKRRISIRPTRWGPGLHLGNQLVERHLSLARLGLTQGPARLPLALVE